VLRDGSDGAL